MRRKTLFTTITLAMIPLAAAAQTVPTQEAAAKLGLTGVELRHSDQHGEKIRALLPSGQPVEVDVKADGFIDEVEARGNAPAPLEAVAMILPEGLIAQNAQLQGATFYKLDIDRDEIEIEGRSADGRPFEAEFDAAGNLRSFEYDD